MEYYIPRQAMEARKRAEEKPEAVFIAGGTDLSLLMYESLLSPEELIDISEIDELKVIDRSDSCITIGAAVTMRELSERHDIPVCLSRGASAVGSPQVRNLATLGGNICNASPCGDTLPGILSLDATLHILGSSGDKRVRADQFFTGPKKTVMEAGDLLLSVDIPLKYLGGYSGFAKIGKRRGQVISQVNTAVWFDIDPEGMTITEIHIAAGSVAPVPVRLAKLESELTGKKVDEELKDYIREAAGNHISPITDVRAAEWYRRDVMGSLILEAVERAAGIPGENNGGAA